MELKQTLNFEQCLSEANGYRRPHVDRVLLFDQQVVHWSRFKHPFHYMTCSAITSLLLISSRLKNLPHPPHHRPSPRHVTTLDSTSIAQPLELP